MKKALQSNLLNIESLFLCIVVPVSQLTALAHDYTPCNKENSPHNVMNECIKYETNKIERISTKKSEMYSTRDTPLQ